MERADILENGAPSFIGLDRTRFQPWVVFYPSGFRLSWIAEGIRQSLSEVFVNQKFEKLIVIAHSMGGMIARSLLNVVAQTYEVEHGEIMFITLSTPWGGHQAAQIGVDYAPAVIPSWVDMVPGSPFQQRLVSDAMAGFDEILFIV